MKRREVILKSIVMIAITFVVLSAVPVKADLTNSSIDIPGLASYQQGVPGTLSNAPDYAWWYGCSPTSAGMMMGYYDNNGYDGLYYTNLVPGGVAETETFVGPPTGASALANQTIASAGHIADFWGTSDPLGSGRAIPGGFDCLADFMGTSQASLGNGDGGTNFWFWTNGSPMTEANVQALGSYYYDSDGMYGVGEYLTYAGYDAATLYSQILPGVADDVWKGEPSNDSGFTLDDYKAEIDAGRPVMIQVLGHSMFGYGYVSEESDIINVYDTWGPAGQNPGTMTWGGYYDGMLHYGVMVLEVTGGAVVPVPAAVLLGMLGLGVVGIKLRRYA